MADRHFPIQNERYGNAYRKIATINCATCGMRGVIGIQTAASVLPDQAVQKKFIYLGWEVGKNPQKDTCPACVGNKKHDHLEEQREMSNTIKDEPRHNIGTSPPFPIPQAPAPKPKTEPVRVMSRDDRRIIYTKLDETYVDEKTGYDKGWSDHKVATDLGVPRKWVEDVRSEMFGALGTSSEMSDFLNQCNNVLAEAREYYEAMRGMYDDIQKMQVRPEFLNANKISDRLSALEKLATEVRKLVVY